MKQPDELVAWHRLTRELQNEPATSAGHPFPGELKKGLGFGELGLGQVRTVGEREEARGWQGSLDVLALLSRCVRGLCARAGSIW